MIDQLRKLTDEEKKEIDNLTFRCALAKNEKEIDSLLLQIAEFFAKIGY